MFRRLLALCPDERLGRLTGPLFTAVELLTSGRCRETDQNILSLSAGACYLLSLSDVSGDSRASCISVHMRGDLSLPVLSLPVGRGTRCRLPFLVGLS